MFSCYICDAVGHFHSHHRPISYRQNTTYKCCNATLFHLLIDLLVYEAYLDQELGEPECYQDGDQREQNHGHMSSQQTHPAEEQLHPWA